MIFVPISQWFMEWTALLMNGLKGYRQHGYNVQFMTGIAWGNYQDYFTGKWDGKEHEEEEGQVERNGNHIGHGKGIPYIVPTDNFITYFKTVIKKVIDAGITTIYLEEPEFWARAGYSEAFKRRMAKILWLCMDAAA